jgi:N-acetylglucosaminyl-diphospho-decaprenol L-rhamnosyltransferase
MILSVVIVSYNVKFFLEQCLSSLKKAVDGSAELRGHAEVFVVDNASVDGSLAFLTPLYPAFRFIQNKDNAGFARANNQVLPLCTGEFILFLNPDTILAEDSLDCCLSFFRVHPEAGALGVHMVDGGGRYLKESKRGFPDPITSFYKMAGLTRLFPRSKTFSSYYLGHLDEKESHAVDILSGAFMMIKRSTLDKTGGFDEQFFMYAEDIDLSYRISQSGLQNYYLSATTIIHFKGESTRKDFRYNKMFYSSMTLFMKKHFRGTRSLFHLFSLIMAVKLHQALAYFFMLTSKKQDAFPVTGLNVLIKGEPADQEKWKRKLAEENIPVAGNETPYEKIIFCEGPHLSWKTIIEEITNHSDRMIFNFHGSGTHAAVGSYSGRCQGEVLEL